MLLSVMIGILSGAASVSERSNLTPALDLDFPDPFILVVDDALYAYATNTVRSGRRLNVQMSRADDGSRFSDPIDAMPVTPAWVRQDRPDIWAPEVMAIDERYVLYFSARHATRRRPDGLTLCVGAAVADRPEGPFEPLPGPLSCGGAHGVIDASPFRDGDDLWLHIKTDGNCCRTPVQIQVYRLTADGLRVLGEPISLQGIANDDEWEGAVVEAPQMVVHDGRYWLFYSGADYGGPAYAVGYATCQGPFGPCADAPENPMLKTPDDASGPIGPGHQTLFRWRGCAWLAHHGWRLRIAHERWAYRALYIQQLDWTTGRPRLHHVAPAPF